MHESLEIQSTDLQDTNSSVTTERAELIAKYLRRWLSLQNKPWLLVIDQLPFIDTSKTGDDMEREAMGRVLHDLFKAEQGRIIITSRYTLDQDEECWESPFHIPAMSPDVASQLIKAHLQDRPLGRSEVRAGVKLCETLDFLPQLISFACTTIRAEKISIADYLKRRREVFEQLPRNSFSKDESVPLNVTMKISYDGLKNRNTEAGQLCPIDLLNILVCLNSSHVSETLFSRAWKSSSLDHLQATCAEEANTWTVVKTFRPLKSLFQPRALKVEPIDLKFLVRQPYEKEWKGSLAQRSLRAALRTLEESFFLEFTNDPVECTIKVSPLVQGWIRCQPFAYGSLDEEGFRQSWRQAAMILATSMSLESWGWTRESKQFPSFHRHAASHIEQLQRIGKELKLPPKFDHRVKDAAIWTAHVLSLPGASETASLFADALSFHGFTTLALDMRQACNNTTNISENSINGFVKRLAYAESLAQDGKHLQALEHRKATLQSLPDLQILDVLTGNLTKLDPIQQTLLKLIVRRDIADSYWSLGSEGNASGLLKSVLTELEKIQTFFEGPDGRKAFLTILMETRLDRTLYLVRHRPTYEDIDGASVLMKTILDDIRGDSKSHLLTYDFYLRALSLDAEIRDYQGHHLIAKDRREEVLRKRKHLDSDMRLLDTMIAQDEYANSLSALGEHRQSLKLRIEVNDRLKDSDCILPREHDFIRRSQQNLANCYMDVAGPEPKGSGRLLCVSKAVRMTQDVLEACQERVTLGPMHEETLTTLTQLIKFERKAKTLEPHCKLRRLIAEAEFNKTCSMQERNDKKPSQAFLMLKIEHCLVEDLEERISRLTNLQRDLHENEVPESTGCSIRHEIASAEMNFLYLCNDRSERKRMRTEPRFKNAAKVLESVWEQRRTLLGPQNRVTLQSLKCAVNAYSALKDIHHLELQEELCGLFNIVYGEESKQAQDERKILSRGKNERQR